MAYYLAFFKGSIFVTREAKKYLEGSPDSPRKLFDFENSQSHVEFLQDSNFHEDVPDIAEKFDKVTKLSFRDPGDPQYIKFGRMRDRDPNRGIRAGQLRLDGCVFFVFTSSVIVP